MLPFPRGYVVALLFIATCELTVSGRVSQQSALPNQQPPSALWYELYDKGIADVRQGRWSDAEAALEAAKKSGPSPGLNVLYYGTVRRSFFPDYYLGIVYFNTKRLKNEAASAFALAKTQGIDTTNTEFRRLETYLRELSQQPAANVTQENLSTSSTERGTFDYIYDFNKTRMHWLKTAPDTWVEDAPPGSSYPPITFRKTGRTVVDGNSGVVVRAQDRPMDVFIPDTAATGTRPDWLRQRGDQKGAEWVLLGAVVNDDEASVAAAEAEGMTQFFDGDYLAAIRTLGTLTTPRAYFYQACSHAALALRSQPVDTGRLALARQLYGKASTSSFASGLPFLNTTPFRSDERYVSPRILQSLKSEK